MTNYKNPRTFEDPIDIDPFIVRTQTGLSQMDFSNRYGFPLKTIKEWEDRYAKPDQSSRILLNLIYLAPDEINAAYRKAITAQYIENKVNENSKNQPQLYLGMLQGVSYPFVDIPMNQCGNVIKHLHKLGWKVGGQSSLMNSRNLPQLEDGYVRIWGITWHDK